MPYLASDDRRATLDAGAVPQDGAELNYVIARLVDRFIGAHGLSYHTLEEIDGALGLSQHEFRRRIVADYEDLKAEHNGEVFTFAIGALDSLWEGYLRAHK